MLKQRIITAIALVIGLLAALFYLPPLYWGILMAGVAATAAYEWGALSGLKPKGWGCSIFGGVIGAFLLDASFYYAGYAKYGRILWYLDTWIRSFTESISTTLPGIWYLGILCFMLAALFWCLVAPFWLWRRWQLNQTWWGKGILLGFGACLILATWFAFVHLRLYSPMWLLVALGIAWVSDISAYFTGRKFGGRKLAPNISPGKTWAGVWGALVGVSVYAVIFVLLANFVLFAKGARSAYSVSEILVAIMGWLLVFLVLAVLGIMGDLFESLLKRQIGIKDSGNILPGHGGILDRIDSLLAILPCFTLVLSLLGLYMWV